MYNFGLEDEVGEQQGSGRTGSYSEGVEISVPSVELEDEVEDGKQDALGWIIRRWFYFIWEQVW